METELKSLGFALGISLGLMLVFMGNFLIITGVFGNEIIWKELIIGFILLFIGFFSAILTINLSHRGV